MAVRPYTIRVYGFVMSSKFSFIIALSISILLLFSFIHIFLYYLIFGYKVLKKGLEKIGLTVTASHIFFFVIHFI